MTLDSNAVQPNAVVDLNGTNLTVVPVDQNLVALANHDDGSVKLVTLSYLLENGSPVTPTAGDNDADDTNPSAPTTPATPASSPNTVTTGDEPVAAQPTSTTESSQSTTTTTTENNPPADSTRSNPGA